MTARGKVVGGTPAGPRSRREWDQTDVARQHQVKGHGDRTARGSTLDGGASARIERAGRSRERERDEQLP